MASTSSEESTSRGRSRSTRGRGDADVIGKNFTEIKLNIKGKIYNDDNENNKTDNDKNNDINNKLI